MSESGPLDFHLIVSEILWEQEGRHVVFPENEQFIQNLLDAKFSIDGSASIHLPRKSFSLAMPKNFKVDGVTIPSVMVHYTTEENRTVRYHKALSLMSEPSIGKMENTYDGLDCLSFFYQDPYEEQGVMVQVNQTPLQISSAIKASSPEEYSQILGEIPKEFVSNDTSAAQAASHTDHVIQFAMTRIIAGISAYMSARGMNDFIDGLPNKGRVQLDNLKTDVRYNYSYIEGPDSLGAHEKATENIMTTRRWFFRNLRHEKYYQNKYKNDPIGSRWTFVNETKVGNYQPEHIS